MHTYYAGLWSADGIKLDRSFDQSALCSVLVYIDLFPCVNLSVALSLDIKAWNVPFFSSFCFLYVYCVHVFYGTNCCSPVSLLFLYLFFSFLWCHYFY